MFILKLTFRIGLEKSIMWSFYSPFMVPVHLIDDTNTSILVLAAGMAKLSPESKHDDVFLRNT